MTSVVTLRLSGILLLRMFDALFFLMCDALWSVQTSWWQARSAHGKYYDECVVLD